MNWPWAYTNVTHRPAFTCIVISLDIKAFFAKRKLNVYKYSLLKPYETIFRFICEYTVDRYSIIVDASDYFGFCTSVS